MNFNSNEPLRPPSPPDEEDCMGLDIIITEGPDGEPIVDTVMRDILPRRPPRSGSPP